MCVLLCERSCCFAYFFGGKSFGENFGLFCREQKKLPCKGVFLFTVCVPKGFNCKITFDCRPRSQVCVLVCVCMCVLNHFVNFQNQILSFTREEEGGI